MSTGYVYLPLLLIRRSNRDNFAAAVFSLHRARRRFGRIGWRVRVLAIIVTINLRDIRCGCATGNPRKTSNGLNALGRLYSVGWTLYWTWRDCRRWRRVVVCCLALMLHLGFVVPTRCDQRMVERRPIRHIARGQLSQLWMRGDPAGRGANGWRSPLCTHGPCEEKFGLGTAARRTCRLRQKFSVDIMPL
jgi:hypothetical protein